MSRKRSYTRGFKSTASLLSSQIRQVGEGRGFAVSRLLTHWAEIVGEDIANQARPVDVSYGKGGFGATLTLLINGAHGPMLEMQSERIRQKVNATYGYNAITRLRFTQTAASGFADEQAGFDPAPKAPSPQVTQAARAAAQAADDPALRAAIERLATNVLTQNNREKDR